MMCRGGFVIGVLRRRERGRAMHAVDAHASARGAPCRSARSPAARWHRHAAANPRAVVAPRRSRDRSPRNLGAMALRAQLRARAHPRPKATASGGAAAGWANDGTGSVGRNRGSRTGGRCSFVGAAAPGFGSGWASRVGGGALTLGVTTAGGTAPRPATRAALAISVAISRTSAPSPASARPAARAECRTCGTGRRSAY